MRAVLQRVSSASVSVDGEVVGRINEPGLVVLLGMTHGDGPPEVAWMARKVRDLRIMRNERSLAEMAAPILLISQFTLYGDAHRGRRPTWQAAAAAEVSEPLFTAFHEALEHAGTHVQSGIFGADMAVAMVNDGPMTIVLES